MKLSIIIVNWNTGPLLATCLRSVLSECQALASRGSSWEIIVVDNHSSDDSLDAALALEKQFGQVILMQNRQNAGFARANNQGIRRASGDYILLLNPDTEVKPGAISALLGFMDAHPRAGAAGPHILNPDGSLQTSCYPAPTLPRELWYLLHLDLLWPFAQYPMKRWALDSARPVDSLLGACLLVRRSALGETGLLDEDFFMYSEEIDLCHRLRQAGWSLHWVPQARIVHYGGQSTRQVAGPMFLQLYRSKLHFFRKHNGRHAGWLYKLLLFTIAAPRVFSVPLALIPSRWSPYLRQVAANYARLIRALPAL